MEFHLSGGFETTNLIVTLCLVAGLLLGSRLYNILDKNGCIAAAVIGLMVGILGHWSWLIVLLTFLVSSHKATKWCWAEKEEKGFTESAEGQRGWQNVLANGGIPALVAIAAYMMGAQDGMFWVFVAGVAVASADTWASEFGCLDNRVRMITTMQPCEAGVNGGFSPDGQLAAFAGASIISVVALIVGWLPAGGDFEMGIFLAGLAAVVGWFGCQVDSVLGAVLENRGLMTKGNVNTAAITSGVIATWACLEYLNLY